MNAGPFRYRAWGWNIEVPMPVPELDGNAEGGMVDWVLRVGETPAYRGNLQFVLPNGVSATLVSQHLACVQANRAPEELHPSLLRSVIAVALRNAGCIVLHAAAIEVDGRVAVLAGSSGSGKTTLAAALCSIGGRLLGDELCVIGWQGESPVVLPGSTLLALHPDAIALLGLDEPGEDGMVRHGRVLTPVPTCRTALPPDALCLLGWSDGEGVKIDRLPAPQAMPLLLGARFQPGIGPVIVDAGELPQISRLVSGCPVLQVTRPPTAPPVDAARAIVGAMLDQ